MAILPPSRGGTGKRLGRPSHIIVKGCLAFGYPGFAGIASEQGDHLIIEHNTSHGNKLGLDIGSGVHNRLRHNVIFACETGIALSSNIDSEVCGNVIQDIQNEAIYAYYWNSALAQWEWDGDTNGTLLGSITGSARPGFYIQRVVATDIVSIGDIIVTAGCANTSWD